MTKSINRGTFIKNGIVAGVLCTVIIILAYDLIPNQAYASSANEITISLDMIERLMKRGSVEKILREEYDSGLIQDIEYDRSAEVYSTDICSRINDEAGNFIGVIKFILNLFS